MKNQFITVNNIKIRYVEQGEQRSQTLILLHGLGGSVENWQHNIPALSQHFHVIALDLPGFGLSENFFYIHPNYRKSESWCYQTLKSISINQIQLNFISVFQTHQFYRQKTHKTVRFFAFLMTPHVLIFELVQK